MACTYREALTSVGEQEEEQLRNLQELRIQALFQSCAGGVVSFACLLHKSSDHFRLNVARF